MRNTCEGCKFYKIPSDEEPCRTCTNYPFGDINCKFTPENKNETI